MNNKIKLIIGLMVFAIFLGGAYTAYSSLSEKYASNQETALEQKGENTEANNQSSSAPNTEENSSKSEAGETKKISAPDFTVYGTDGAAYKLSDFQGKPVVLNFWASWCPPCREEMPHFNEVYKEYKNEVAFLMVDLADGQRETEETGKAFIKKEGYDFPIYFDKNNHAASVYGITTIPTTLFIDAEGYIFTGYRGPLNKATLEKELKGML